MKTKPQTVAISWAVAERFWPPIFLRVARVRGRQRPRDCASHVRVIHCQSRETQYFLRYDRSGATRAVR